MMAITTNSSISVKPIRRNAVSLDSNLVIVWYLSVTSCNFASCGYLGHTLFGGEWKWQVGLDYQWLNPQRENRRPEAAQLHEGSFLQEPCQYHKQASAPRIR